jgi:hypothetical protein
VRRSSVASFGSGPESPAYGDGSQTMVHRDAPAAKTLWTGGGGRWLVWHMRIVHRVAILVIGYRSDSSSDSDQHIKVPYLPAEPFRDAIPGDRG